MNRMKGEAAQADSPLMLGGKLRRIMNITSDIMAPITPVSRMMVRGSSEFMRK